MSGEGPTLNAAVLAGELDLTRGSLRPSLLRVIASGGRVELLMANVIIPGRLRSLSVREAAVMALLLTRAARAAAKQTPNGPLWRGEKGKASKARAK